MHILTLLDKFPDELLSSEFIAGSININPVLVRKEISNLRKHGLVKSREGKNGGFELAKTASRITVAEVYGVVRQTPALGKNINSPNPKCKVGKQINKHLGKLYEKAEEALLARLKKITLRDFVNDF
jgi:Rrf2 family protein